MKSISEQNHYEILETSVDASDREIERAYRMSLATYADDSLAGYSVFAEGDAAALRERIEVAYRVLSDPKLRSEYDAAVGVPSGFEEPPPAAQSAGPPPAREETPLPINFAELDDGKGDFDGARLRRFRMRCGLEVEDIAAVTKINPVYLRSIEEERFSELPAAVYVRGFVSAYATCLGLASRPVATSYMKRFDEHRGGRRRGRFFEGR